MYSTRRLTGYFEVHFVLRGMKKVIIVETSTMCEVDSWVCATLYVEGHPDRFVPEAKLRDAMARAAAHGITNVRWNKVQKMDRDRPCLVFSPTLDNTPELSAFSMN